MPLSTWQDKWDRYYPGLKVIFFIAKGSLNWPRNCKQLITLICYFLFQVTWKSFIFTPAQFLWSPNLRSKRSFPNWTSLDPRALLFCAWQTARRALGNPGPSSFVICCWLKQRKRVWLVNLRRGKIWTCLAKVVPPSWEFYVCFLCKSQIVNEIVKCTVFGGFKF